MKLLVALVFVIAVIFISAFDKPPVQDDFDQRLIWRAEHAQQNISSYYTTNRYQRGNIHALTEQYVLTEHAMQQRVAQYTKRYPQRGAYLLEWRDSQRNTISLSAMGLDWQHHFANSYLVGIRPFKVENKWLPLYTIAQMKTYQTDKLQHSVPELWQNSAQAYTMPRGDCEDHAIILADWLISEGIDARVVGGKYKGGGHAWVMAILDDQEFILEATSKRKTKHWNHYPLASLAAHYQPEFMFNRTQFWLNEKPQVTDNYRGLHWREMSYFKSDHHK
ncbi:transglutaminase domain-containing protein [Thalassotalea montiporae]